MKSDSKALIKTKNWPENDKIRSPKKCGPKKCDPTIRFKGIKIQEQKGTPKRRINKVEEGVVPKIVIQEIGFKEIKIQDQKRKTGNAETIRKKQEAKNQQSRFKEIKNFKTQEKLETLAESIFFNQKTQKPLIWSQDKIIIKFGQKKWVS